MRLTRKELEAVLKMTVAMASADGVVTDVETGFIAYELSRFGVRAGEVAALTDAAAALAPEEAIAVIRALGEEQKYYVAAFMAGVMSCDAEVDTAELRLWQYTCALCGLPQVSLAESLEYIRNLD